VQQAVALTALPFTWLGSLLMALLPSQDLARNAMDIWSDLESPELGGHSDSSSS
jgi:hypothetical protein